MWYLDLLLHSIPHSIQFHPVHIPVLYSYIILCFMFLFYYALCTFVFYTSCIDYQMFNPCSADCDCFLKRECSRCYLQYCTRIIYFTRQQEKIKLYYILVFYSFIERICKEKKKRKKFAQPYNFILNKNKNRSNILMRGTF